VLGPPHLHKQLRTKTKESNIAARVNRGSVINGSRDIAGALGPATNGSAQSVQEPVKRGQSDAGAIRLYGALKDDEAII